MPDDVQQPTGPRRIQRSRKAGWKMPDGAVYVGRPTRWGNPWRAVERDQRWFIDGPMINPFRHPCGNREGAALLAIQCFREKLMRPMEGVLACSRVEIVSELRGRDLACWCKQGEPCHADVLLEVANA